MKKFIIFILMALMLSPVFAYTISTSRGDIEVNIPEGMTAEEAFCKMSKLYLEERWDHEDLIEKSQSLSESIDSYISEINELKNKNKNLISEYEKVIDLYSTAIKTKMFTPYIGLSLESDIESNLFGVGISFGGILFEKVLVQTSVLYPWSFQLGLNIII